MMNIFANVTNALPYPFITVKDSVSGKIKQRNKNQNAARQRNYKEHKIETHTNNSSIKNTLKMQPIAVI